MCTQAQPASQAHRAHTEGLTAPYSGTVDAALGPTNRIHAWGQQAYACMGPNMDTATDGQWAALSHKRQPLTLGVYMEEGVGELRRLANPWDPAVEKCKQEVQIVQTRSAVPSTSTHKTAARLLQAAQLPTRSHTQSTGFGQPRTTCSAQNHTWQVPL